MMKFQLCLCLRKLELSEEIRQFVLEKFVHIMKLVSF